MRRSVPVRGDPGRVSHPPSKRGQDSPFPTRGCGQRGAEQHPTRMAPACIARSFGMF